MIESFVQRARKNVAKNNNIQSLDVYLQDITAEIDEVRAEIKKHNHLYLQDELADVLWNYLNVLAILERDGLIKSIDEVFACGEEKYAQRFPAMLSGSRTQWNAIKAKQKEVLAKKHKTYYGKNNT